MKKELFISWILVLIILGLTLASAANFTYLKAYYDSLDSSCKASSDCVVKNVENCCGYYPLCVNKDAVLDNQEVADICLSSKSEKCIPISISYCRCQRQGDSTRYKCVGFTGNPVTVCGDGNCYQQEANSSSDKYCPSDCGSGSGNVSTTDYYSCEKDEDCVSYNFEHCSCKGVIAINKNYIKQWENNNRIDCATAGGCTPFNESLYIDNISKCNNNICTLIEKSSNICPQLTQPNCPQGGEIKSQGKDDKGCDNPGKCVFKFSNGRNSEIKIMPDTASERAIARLGELGFNITLKEVGSGNSSKAVYEATAEKQGKFLGLFKVNAKVSAEIDAETGEVISVHKPWWSFLAGI